MFEICERVNVPCSPVNKVDQTFAMEQTRHREMQIKMKHALKQDEIALVGSPLKLSETPVSYECAPPVCGQDTDKVLKNLLDLSADAIAELKARKIIDEA